MTKYFTVSILSLFCIRCTDNTNVCIKKDIKGVVNQDSLKNLSVVVEVFNKDERVALDSIKKYSLDSLNNRCKKMLYVLYADDTLENNNDTITIGECSIRLIKFTNISKQQKELTYGVFVYDSIPVLWKFKKILSYNMIHTFGVDTEKRKIIIAKLAESGTMAIKDIEYSYDTLLNGDRFQNYLLKYKNRLHYNFKMLLQ